MKFYKQTLKEILR